MIAIAGVLALAGASVGIAVLSAIAARHPDRAAMVLVLTVAGGGLGVFLLGMMGVLGIGGAGPVGVAQPSILEIDPRRLTIGLGVAAMLLAAVIVLIRTGDWDRHDDQSQP